jgi:hypothetical protein
MEPYEIYTCPKCGATNVVALGNLDDLTSSIGTEPAYRCWSCFEKTWRRDIEDPDFREEMVSEGIYDESISSEENLIEVSYEEGKPTSEYDSVEAEYLLEELDPKFGTKRNLVFEVASAKAGVPIWSLRRPERLRIVASCLDEKLFPKFKDEVGYSLQKDVVLQAFGFGAGELEAWLAKKRG